MAGFNLDTQRGATMHGLRVETGHVTFSAASATLSVPTGLNQLFAGLAVAETSSPNFTVGCTVNRTISGGNVTITRHAAYLGDAPVVDYVFLGW